MLHPIEAEVLWDLKGGARSRSLPHVMDGRLDLTSSGAHRRAVRLVLSPSQPLCSRDLYFGSLKVSLWSNIAYVDAEYCDMSRIPMSRGIM